MAIEANAINAMTGCQSTTTSRNELVNRRVNSAIAASFGAAEKNAVTGVGARIACAILSVLSPQELAYAVESGSTDALVSVPGVGKKLASRILLESKGRLPDDLEPPAPAGSPKAAGADAVQALTSLGYSPSDSREAVRAVLQKYGTDAPPLDELLRQALVGLTRAGG